MGDRRGRKGRQTKGEKGGGRGRRREMGRKRKVGGR